MLNKKKTNIENVSARQAKIAAVILAGGAGSRMQGVDKGLQLYNGKALTRCVSDILTKQVGSLIISANRSIAEYRSFGFEVISDTANLGSNLGIEHQGPMAGIAAGLHHLNTKPKIDLALISSCDTPLLPNDLVQRLYADLIDNDTEVAVAHDGERRQNLHCLIKRCAWTSLITAFDGGERAMYRWQNTQSLIEVDFADCPEAFSNFNTLESLE